MTLPAASESGLANAQREARFVLWVWLAACGYTVGYAALFAYGKEAPPLVGGMPSWVVWGIFLPWVTCTVVTCWFALRGIRDEDLGEERPESPAEEAGGGR
jgi:uncharacterized membrane protein YhdT